ncbi:MAG: RsmE family RNA methyltransferase [Calditrichaeota bacterium]|nr:MAG: RsmE family RNA methyltransferase [Calditrichota bacterium]
MNILLLFEKDSHGDGRYKITGHRADHIRTILKAQTSDSIDIGILNGPKGTAEIESIDENKIILSNLKLNAEPDYKNNVDIICALPRPQTVKKVLFICGMMAVRNLFFIRANRVEKSYYHSPLLEKQNLNEHLYDGMMQGKNTRLPNVDISDKFKPFFEDFIPKYYKDNNESPTLLLPHIETENNIKSVRLSLSKSTPNQNVPLSGVEGDVSQNRDNSGTPPFNVGSQKNKKPNDDSSSPLSRSSSHLSREGGSLITFAIGPEGGWVDFELDLMESKGFHRIKLSDHTLRVEHALMACLSQLEIL